MSRWTCPHCSWFAVLHPRDAGEYKHSIWVHENILCPVTGSRHE